MKPNPKKNKSARRRREGLRTILPEGPTSAVRLEDGSLIIRKPGGRNRSKYTP